MIPVTKPYLPKEYDYKKYLEGIWQRNWLTNDGPLVNEFELKLKKYLDQKHLIFVGNGTLALQIAIRALEIRGEVITTPFSYVATTSSLVWEGCKPVFVDIDENTLNINPKLIEASISKNTTAILATHCFGNACNIDAIQEIADRYNLKVIYDAAHCFGTKYKGKSIFSFGGISTLSLHATKLMHSIEGGAVFTQKPELLKKMAFMRNFGHDGPSKFNGVGINAKNSEFHAAMGLCVLQDIPSILKKREEQSLYYDFALTNLNIQKPQIQEGCNYNFAYYPIIFETETQAIKAKNALERAKIFPRRYFHPSLNTLDYLDHPAQQLPVSERIASSILCLPIYHNLSKEEQDLIARILLRTQNYQ